MQGFDQRRIIDPVHGTIGLSQLEVDVISTPVFQRLRNVKQLGLAHLVFPGADYSRFSHSVGVCHVTGCILENLRRCNCKIDDSEVQLYRLAGLLHDIGHYPFSHAMEHAIADFYATRVTEGKEPIRHLKHESVSKNVLEHNNDLQQVLKNANVAPEAIYKIFNREEPPRFANLISSDLDADRIDYLMRTAHHTGLPYGSVDLPYLLSQLRVDKDNRICLTQKALRTAEHFLLGRLFDYQQTAFHKTVVSMEWLLRDLIWDLLAKGALDGSADRVVKAIKEGSWDIFDDAHIMEKIRGLIPDNKDEIIVQKARALIERQPPKLLAEIEYVDPRETTNAKQFLGAVQAIKEKIPAWVKQFGIPEPFWHVWQPRLMTLTKIGSHIAVSTGIEEGKDESADAKEGWEQAVRIMKEDNTSKPIMEQDASIMKILADSALYSCRIYVMPHSKTDLSAVKVQIKKDLPHHRWK